MNRKSIQMNLKKPRWMTGAIAGSGVFLLAMGILIASRQPQPEATAADAETIVAAEAIAPEPVAPPKKPRARKTAKPVARKAVAQTAKPAAAETVAAASEAPVLRLAPADPIDARAEEAAASAAAYTTITGCLELDDDQFRLKDAEGENVPKARSWKSGFLKKGAARVDVVDPSNRLRLQNHVGQRVSVTGTLLDRELQARSVQRVATSCDR
jgi:hypothetical protein